MANELVNKVVYGNTTLIDLTADTVDAAHLLSGYTAHDRTGAAIVGTASDGSVSQDQDGYIVLPSTGSGGGGGGGGLEYEEGTVTVSVTSSNYTIQFSDTHSTLPSFYVISLGGDYSYVNKSVSVVFSLTEDYGAPMDDNYGHCYGTVARMTIGSSSYSTTMAVTRLAYPSSDPGQSSIYYPRYWATETGITLPAGSSSQAGGTYKWMAVWR